MHKLLTVDQVAALGNVSKRTLQFWAADWDEQGAGTGPRAYRLGPKVTRYRLDDVAAWLGVDPSEIRLDETWTA